MSTRWSSDSRPTAAEYDARWARLGASGAELHGEATFVLAYAPRSVLDAGCGTGRVAIELARHGVDVAGVDLDAGFIDEARRKASGVEWHLGDLATVDLGRSFDLIVLAGNVMIFLSPGTEARVLANLAGSLSPGGRVVAGFQLGSVQGDARDHSGLSLAGFDACAESAGLVVLERFATWDRDPFTGSAYAVSVLGFAASSRQLPHSG